MSMKFSISIINSSLGLTSVQQESAISSKTF